MGIPGPLMQTPYVMEFGDYVGNVVRISVHFDLITRLILGIIVYRDEDCLWKRILLGLGEDGTPDTSTRTFDIPIGSTTLTALQLTAIASKGLATIEDFQSHQITAGP